MYRNKPEMKQRLFKIFYALIPLAFWMVVLSMPLFSSFDHLPKQFRQARTFDIISTNILLIFIFYIHHYFIYPLKNSKNGVLNYSLCILGCLLVYLTVNHFIHQRDLGPLPAMTNAMPRPPRPNFLMPILPFSLVIVSGFCYQQYLDRVKREKLIKELENIQLKTELAFLSSQIEPHFIFNILNTMVSMARKKSAHLETSLINLSQLMRYMLYSNNGKTINLAEEIDYVKSYIDLQMLRYEDDVKLKLQLIGDFSNYQIEPMLLIPFIENAFKHGIGNIEQPNIDISIFLDEKDQRLKTMVINSISPTPTSSGKESGIGLTNVKRRLELLYPNRHLFSIEKKNDNFIALLQISLVDELYHY